MKKIDFTEQRGDTFSLYIHIVDENNSNVDITGDTFWFTLKNELVDPDSSAVLQIEQSIHDDPTAGVTVLTLTASQTKNLLGRYYYDVQWKNGSVVETFMTGSITFIGDVTIDFNE